MKHVGIIIVRCFGNDLEPVCDGAKMTYWLGTIGMVCVMIWLEYLKCFRQILMYLNVCLEMYKCFGWNQLQNVHAWFYTVMCTVSYMAQSHGHVLHTGWLHDVCL